MKRKRLVVIDTNCLIQMISKHSPYRPVWDAFLQKRYDICVSNEIIEEYQEILERQTTISIAERIILVLMNSSNVRIVNPQYRFNLIEKDPDDNKFVDCAITGDADFIVSDDAHFKVLNNIRFPHVRVRYLRDFLLELQYE